MREREEIQEVLRRPFKLIPVLIILFWVVMMAVFLRREVFLPRLGAGTGPGAKYADKPSEACLGLFLPDHEQVGFIHVRTWPSTRGVTRGAQVTLQAKVRMALLGSDSEITISGTSWVAQERGLEDFDFRVLSGEHKLRVEGKVVDGSLKANVHTAGETFPLELPVKKDVMLWSGMGTNPLSMPGMVPGEEYLIDTFDPLTFSTGQARMSCLREETIEIGGEQIQAKVISVNVNGMTTQAWVDAQGETLRAETPFGFSLERMNPDDPNWKQNLAELPATSASSLLETAAIRPSGLTVARGAKRMVIALSGLPPEVNVPTDATQRVTDQGHYVIECLPEPSDGGATATEGDVQPADLAGDAFVQVDHPKVKALAAEIVGDATQPWDKAERIYSWVYENIKKEIVMSMPSALDVLTTREGDCNEHTVLFTALARAAGVPTRIAVGIVWSDELGGFYYHAWPEVYAGRWIWMDPTLGQPIADATHIKLVSGGIERWAELLGFLGQLKVEVLEIDSANKG